MKKLVIICVIAMLMLTLASCKKKEKDYSEYDSIVIHPVVESDDEDNNKQPWEYENLEFEYD